MGEAYLHLKEGRPKGGPAADPLQEGHLGLWHCLVSVLVTLHEEALEEDRAGQGLSRAVLPRGGPSILGLDASEASEALSRVAPIYLRASLGGRLSGSVDGKGMVMQPTSHAQQCAHHMGSRT